MSLLTTDLCWCCFCGLNYTLFPLVIINGTCLNLENPDGVMWHFLVPVMEPRSSCMGPLSLSPPMRIRRWAAHRNFSTNRGAHRGSSEWTPPNRIHFCSFYRCGGEPHRRGVCWVCACVNINVWVCACLYSVDDNDICFIYFLWSLPAVECIWELLKVLPMLHVLKSEYEATGDWLS